MLSEFLRHVPLWVWPLLAALIALGWMQSTDRTVSIARAWITPAVFVPFSAYGVWSSFGPNPLAFVAWGVGLASALLLNALAIKMPRHAALMPDGTVNVPGSWLPMLLILVIFSARFVLGATKGIAPQAVTTPQFMVVFGFILGLCSGLFLAMTLKIAALPGKGVR